MGGAARRLCRWVVPDLGEPCDDHRRNQFDVLDLRMPSEQVGEQQPILQPLRELHVEVDDTGACISISLISDTYRSMRSR